jgi:Flp pilus assembly CpaF family ATPase
MSDSDAIQPEDVIPEGIPEQMLPAGAEEWKSGGQTLEDILPQPSEDFSESTNSAIEAINQGLLHESCTQLDGYGPDMLSAQVDGENMLVKDAKFPDYQSYELWIKELVNASNSTTTWNDIETDRMGVLELPGGERLCVFLDVPSRGTITFSLRKHNSGAWAAQDFVQLGTLNAKMMDFLQIMVAAHANILFVGPMGAGKTSLLRSLAQYAISDSEKIAVVEQVPELNIQKPFMCQYIYQPTKEGLGLTEILDFNLYNGLQRLIVGEIHIEGLSKMLETMIVTEGSMSTYHAYSVDEAVARMQTAMQIEHTNLTSETAAKYMRQALELIVVIEKINDKRVVTQIAEVDWRASSGDDSFQTHDLFTFDPTTGRHQAEGEPLDDNGRLVKKLAKYNLEVDRSWFFEGTHMDEMRNLANQSKV